MSDADISRVIRLHTPEPGTKGSPEWVKWRTQRAQDIVAAATGPDAPKDQGFLHGLWQAVNPLPMVNQILGSGAVNPENGENGGPIQGIENAASNAIGAQIEQGRKAADAWKRGDRTEAVGHAMAAALPLFGPAAANAGEAIGEGRTGEGFGQAAGIVGSILAPTAAVKAAGAVDRLVPAARPAIANTLRTDAVKEYAQALAPTTKGNKARTAEVVPELIDRGVSAGSLKGLAARAQREITSVGQAIGDEWNNLPAGTSTEFKPIWDRLQSEVDNVHSIGDSNGKLIPKGPEAARAIGSINKLQETLLDVAETDPQTGKLMIPVDKVRDLRQYFDGVAQAAGRYDGQNLATQSTAMAHSIAADAIRNELAKQFPSIDALNKEYSFWKDVNQVVTDTVLRKQGQGPSLGGRIAKASGQAAGMVAGGVKGAVLAGEAMEKLEGVMQSPAWRTVSAVYKDRLADAISAGNTGAIGFYTKKIVQAAGTQPMLTNSPQSTGGVMLAPGSALAPALP